MSGVSVAMRDARFPELEKGRGSPGSPATVSLVSGRRPVALRPTLSSGLPLSSARKEEQMACRIQRVKKRSDFNRLEIVPNMKSAIFCHYLS